MADERPEWQQLELLIAEIQKDLAPGATITHNATLWGHDSETNRQIDVLVEQQIGQFPMRIIFDCKDYKVPVDVKGVDGFISMVRDVRAHQGCLVSAKGFTASAKKARASSYSNIPIRNAPSASARLRTASFPSLSPRSRARPRPPTKFSRPFPTRVPSRRP